MLPIVARRTLSILLAIGCISLVVLLVLMYLQRTNELKPVSLAERVDEEEVTLFIATNNRETLGTLIEKYTKTDTINLDTLPLGKRYEYAMLETGSGSMWMIEIEQDNKKRVALSSAGTLSAMSPSMSLANGNAVQQQIKKRNSTWVYAKPDVLLQKNKGIVQSTFNALIGQTENILISWNDDTSGTLLVQGIDSKQRSSNLPSADLSPAPLLRIDARNPSLLMEEWQKQITMSSPDVAEGITGILTYALKPYLGNISIDEAKQALLAGAANVFIAQEEDGIAYALIGTARSTRDIQEWLNGLSAPENNLLLREITFPKNENVRRDVINHQNSKPVRLTELNGWERSVIGSGTTMPLFIAEQNRRYMISTHEELLTKLLTNTTTERAGVIGGSIDTEWLRSNLRAIKVSENDLGQMIKKTTKRIDWGAEPTVDGWLIYWAVNKIPPSPESSSLAK